MTRKVHDLLKRPRMSTDGYFLVDAEVVCHDSVVPSRLSIVKGKAPLCLEFLALFGPSFLRGQGCDFAPALRRHGHKAHLSAFRSAPLAHLRHNHGDNALVDGFGLGNQGIEHALGRLNLIFALRNAFTTWHASRVARIRASRQEGRLSN